uniref:Uncharacterized protein n=1 Tax=Acrobeloides nanus TaxID=290746 RepID=A0A914EGP8_9BILA
MAETSRSNCSDDESDDGLWNEFETCAQSVAHLFRGANWKNLQTAASNTTQLYKSGLECKKRSFEKGFVAGRHSLAKEILALCRYSNKVDVQDIFALLSRSSLLPNDFRAQTPRNRTTQPTDSSAVNLFQQALCPPPNASPHRQQQPDLNNFLQTQLYRHRKRAHSPTTNNSPCSSPNYMFKRFKRL